jgi:hypothetical protein
LIQAAHCAGELEAVVRNVVTVAKSGLACDHVDRMAALFHEIARALNAKVLDRLRWGLARLGMESPTELPRA